MFHCFFERTNDGEHDSSLEEEAEESIEHEEEDEVLEQNNFLNINVRVRIENASDKKRE